MKTSILCILAILLFYISFSLAQSVEEDFNPIRTWTVNKEGYQKEVQAKAIQYDGKKLTLIPCGRQIDTFSKEEISSTDLEWLEENKDLLNKNKKDLKPVFEILKDLTQINEAKINKNAQYYVILFSANWCPPCRKEMPNIVRLYNETLSRDRKMQFILLSADSNAEHLISWIRKENMKFPVFFDTKTYGEKYNRGIPSRLNSFHYISWVDEGRPYWVPSALIVDRNGQIIARQIKDSGVTKVVDRRNRIVLEKAGAYTMLKKYKELCK